ncbi:MAG TPA: cytochrome c [Steroidobacteraceae bacterium]|jgi:mono/diheme cytochrome c family protein
MMTAQWRRTTSIALVAGLASATLALFSSAAEQKSPSGNPVRGKQLYYAHGCYECHGFNGETGARRLVGTGSSLIADPNAFITFLRLRADAAPLAPTQTMPSYPVTTLSDAAARDIYSYVRTFVLHAPDPKGIATLQTIIDSGKTPYKPSTSPWQPARSTSRAP